MLRARTFSTGRPDAHRAAPSWTHPDFVLLITRGCCFYPHCSPVELERHDLVVNNSFARRVCTQTFQAWRFPFSPLLDELSDSSSFLILHQRPINRPCTLSRRPGLAGA